MTIEAKLGEEEWGNATPGKSPIALLTPNVRGPPFQEVALKVALMFSLLQCAFIIPHL